MTKRVHIVGAGLAGLSAAVHLISQGKPVCLYESTSQAGGRCRSYHDDILNRTIDNGNHLMLSGNVTLNEYLKLIGTQDLLSRSTNAKFDFYDHTTKERWCLNLGSSVIPWAFLQAKNRVPNSKLSDYLAAFKLSNAGVETTVEDVLGAGIRRRSGHLYERLWHPLTTAILNTDPTEAQASSLWPVFKQAFSKGGRSCRPVMALNSKGGLSGALINPAVEWLKARGVSINFNHRLLSTKIVNDRVEGLEFNTGTIPIQANDKVILALPPWVTAPLVNLAKFPNQHRPIINAHFELPEKINELTVIGLTNSVSQWVFAIDDFASVTISAARPYMDLSAEGIAEKIWPEVLDVLGINQCPLGKYRVIKEKRATIAQTPEQNKSRPAFNESGLVNTLLAGDWTATGLPATIEGALLSGKMAANGI